MQYFVLSVKSTLNRNKIRVTKLFQILSKPLPDSLGLALRRSCNSTPMLLAQLYMSRTQLLHRNISRLASSQFTSCSHNGSVILKQAKLNKKNHHRCSTQEEGTIFPNLLCQWYTDTEMRNPSHKHLVTNTYLCYISTACCIMWHTCLSKKPTKILL